MGYRQINATPLRLARIENGQLQAWDHLESVGRLAQQFEDGRSAARSFERAISHCCRPNDFRYNTLGSHIPLVNWKYASSAPSAFKLEVLPNSGYDIEVE